MINTLDSCFYLQLEVPNVSNRLHLHWSSAIMGEPLDRDTLFKKLRSKPENKVRDTVPATQAIWYKRAGRACDHENSPLLAGLL